MRATINGNVSSSSLYINRVIVQKGQEYVVKNTMLDNIYESVKKRLNNSTTKDNAS